MDLVKKGFERLKGRERSPVPPKDSHETSTKPFGLLVLAEGTEPVVDIVAVHGLNGHRLQTWTASNGRCWLRDLLPTKIPNARIYTWGYDANTHSTSPTSTQYIHDHSVALVSDLVLDRRLSQTQKRPIIFVTHSLGGLVVKGALIHSSLSRLVHLERHRSVKLSTYGVIFLGTPHQGGDGVPWAERLLTVASVFVHTNSRILDNLRQDSEFLQHQLEQYAPISGDFVTIFAYETYATPLPVGPALLVVPKSSAVVPGALDAEPIAIMANHLQMTKYISENDDGYKKISGNLQLMVQEADAKVQDRWSREESTLQILTEPIRLSPSAFTTDGLRHERYARCAEWLSFPGADVRESLVASAYPGTFDWILEDKAFLQWIQSNSGVFWIKGKPGSGKSAIMKYLSRLVKSDEFKLVPNKFSVHVSVFFNARGSLLERSIEGFLRSSLLQILKQLPDMCTPIVFDHARTGRQASDSVLTDLLRTLIKDCAQSVRLVLFVDALDEFEGPVRHLIQLFEDLLETSRRHGQPISICASGCPVHNLTPWLQRYPQLILEDHTRFDISTYVMAKTSRLVADEDANLYKEFQQDIIEKAKGVFLWVTLVIEELLDGWETSEPVSNLRQKLASLPEGLEDLFSRMLRKIPTAQVPETVAMFKCVLGTLRPFTLAEFRCALAFGSESSYKSTVEMANSDKILHSDEGLERRIQSCCGGLVEVSKPSLTVQLIHQTVLDFLLTPRVGQNLSFEQSAITPSRCHQYLLRACIEYLSTPELKSIPLIREDMYSLEQPTIETQVTLLETFKFLSYALANWVDHYMEAEKDGHSQSVQIEDFATSSEKHFFTWYRLYCQIFANGWDGISPAFLSFAAEHNLIGYVKDRLSKSTIDSTDEGEFGGPVQAAVVSGNLTMVQLILDHGVDVNAQGGRFGTAMAAAITLQDRSMIKLLKQYGAKIELQSPGSPLLGTERWSGHRNPFSRAKAHKDQTGSNMSPRNLLRPEEKMDF